MVSLRKFQKSIINLPHNLTLFFLVSKGHQCDNFILHIIIIFIIRLGLVFYNSPISSINIFPQGGGNCAVTLVQLTYSTITGLEASELI